MTRHSKIKTKDKREKNKNPQLNWLEVGAKRTSYFHRQWIRKEHLRTFRQEWGNTDVFHSIFRYEEPEGFTKPFLGPLYFDLDSRDLAKAKKDAIAITRWLLKEWKIPEKAIAVAFSGNKGFHITADEKALGAGPSRHLHLVYRKIAQCVKKRLDTKSLDTKIYDRRRLWRALNSRHGKTGLHKIPLSMRELRRMDVKSIKSLAREQRSHSFFFFTPSARARRIFQHFQALARKDMSKGRRCGGRIEKAPPCIAELLQGVEEGERNETAFALSLFLKQHLTASGEELFHKAKKHLHSWNRRNRPPLPNSEVRAAVRSALSRDYHLNCTHPVLEERCDKKQCALYKRRARS